VASPPPDEIVEPELSADPEPPAKRAPDPELERLIEGATRERKTAPPPAAPGSAPRPAHPAQETQAPPAPASQLPETLTRDQVAAGMKLATAEVQACGRQYRQLGVITLRVAIDGRTGRVTAGRVEGPLASSPVARCVLSAVGHQARFPRFSRTPLTLRYPFVLR
jgi:hypothetical protein